MDISGSFDAFSLVNEDLYRLKIGDVPKWKKSSSLISNIANLTLHNPAWVSADLDRALRAVYVLERAEKSPFRDKIAKMVSDEMAVSKDYVTSLVARYFCDKDWVPLLGLIESGLDINAYINGKTLLERALEADEKELAIMLLQKGARFPSKDDNGLCLAHFFFFQHLNALLKEASSKAEALDFVDLAVKQGLPIRSPEGSNEFFLNSILMLYPDHPEIWGKILNVTSFSEADLPPRCVAALFRSFILTTFSVKEEAYEGFLESLIVKLIESGFDINTSIDGKTLLDQAIYTHRTKMAIKLLQKGARFQSKNTEKICQAYSFFFDQVKRLSQEDPSKVKSLDFVDLVIKRGFPLSDPDGNYKFFLTNVFVRYPNRPDIWEKILEATNFLEFGLVPEGLTDLLYTFCNKSVDTEENQAFLEKLLNKMPHGIIRGNWEAMLNLDEEVQWNFIPYMTPDELAKFVHKEKIDPSANQTCNHNDEVVELDSIYCNCSSLEDQVEFFQRYEDYFHALSLQDIAKGVLNGYAPMFRDAFIYLTEVQQSVVLVALETQDASSILLNDWRNSLSLGLLSFATDEVKEIFFHELLNDGMLINRELLADSIVEQVSTLLKAYDRLFTGKSEKCLKDFNKKYPLANQEKIKLKKLINLFEGERKAAPFSKVLEDLMEQTQRWLLRCQEWEENRGLIDQLARAPYESPENLCPLSGDEIKTPVRILEDLEADEQTAWVYERNSLMQWLESQGKGARSPQTRRPFTENDIISTTGKRRKI